jgi:hypothetical protein
VRLPIVPFSPASLSIVTRGYPRSLRRWLVAITLLHWLIAIILMLASMKKQSVRLKADPQRPVSSRPLAAQ